MPDRKRARNSATELGQGNTRSYKSLSECRRHAALLARCGVLGAFFRECLGRSGGGGPYQRRAATSRVVGERRERQAPRPPQCAPRNSARSVAQFRAGVAL